MLKENRFLYFSPPLEHPDRSDAPKSAAPETDQKERLFLRTIGENLRIPKELENDLNRKLIARSLQEKGYSPNSLVEFIAEKKDYGNGVVEYYVMISIDNGNFIKGGQYNWDKALREALKRLPDKDVEARQEIDPLEGSDQPNVAPSQFKDEDFLKEIGRNIRVPKELDNEFNRLLIARALQKNGYSPTSLIEFTNDKSDYGNGVVEFYVRITVDNGRAIKGGGYTWDKSLRSALRNLPLKNEY